MRPLIVLPTYNEAENIVEVLRRVRAAAPTADVLVVDDSSPDGTAGLVAAAASELGGVDVLSRPAKSGLGSAYRDGFKLGMARGYDVLLEMDSDLS
ncbi:MAG: glycosyltransferase, partial [Acidimicrobiia bacterium]|nr:glycosyltransferase [Acidimicrobiia bacterium]